ncbi:hypothetical protein GF359_01695 [candidate division WOR-3 bacterium]|uniref:Uncharacterized protein n=1 Tax=candidate division WOR-3 bacterium TaxID=2052148 RepID=A0A9D5K7Z5_UNCW3|nr:hypothetical protein [candidate division WOR-3 bacterium]MBD3363907.1 hypothetical protein [candidate division WOR-3 bacterium]
MKLIKLLPIITIFLIACGEAGDLVNTYFPADTGYKWVYETRQYLDEGGFFDLAATDTYAIQVDSMRDAMGGKVIYFNGYFGDVSAEMRVIEEDVKVYHGEKEDWIPLTPSKDYLKSVEKGKNIYKIYVDTDTLVISTVRDVILASDETVTKRLKGIGVVEQSWGGEALMIDTRMESRLLYFIKDEDTVYRCPECP